MNTSSRPAMVVSVPAARLAEHFGLGRTESRQLKDGSASRFVYDDLRDRIVRLELPPGVPLPRADLASAYAVSLSPIRDALQQLAEEGLVRIYPQSRTLVARIDKQSILEAQFLRLALETEVARKLAQGIAPDDLARLESILAMQTSLTGTRSDIPLFQELDELFHQALFFAAGHVRTYDLMLSRTGALERLRRLYLDDPEQETGSIRADAVLTGHRGVLDSIAAGDSEAAVAALRTHLNRTVDRLAEKRAAFPQYFD